MGVDRLFLKLKKCEDETQVFNSTSRFHPRLSHPTLSALEFDVFRENSTEPSPDSSRISMMPNWIILEKAHCLLENRCLDVAISA